MLVALGRLYYALSAVPTVLYFWSQHDISQYEGWGRGYAGLVLLVPMGLGIVFGIVGVALIVHAARRGRSWLGPVLATALWSWVAFRFLALRPLVRLFA